MAELVGILGTSGSGKTFSCQHLEASKTLLVSVEGKRPPFSLKGWPKMSKETPDGSFYPAPKENVYSKVKNAINAAVSAGKKIVVVDDNQTLMANSFFQRAHEKGFDKFNSLGQQFWLFLDFLRELPDDVIVYLLHHTEEVEGKVMPMTLGKMVREKGCMEGRLTVCLKAYREDGVGYFSSLVDGQDVFKAPPDMFESTVIENDLAAVDAAIREYWGI